MLRSASYAGNKHFILSPADLLRPVATSYFQIVCYYRCFCFVARNAGRPFLSVGASQAFGAQGQMWRNMRLDHSFSFFFFFSLVWVYLLPSHLNFSHLHVKPLHYGVRIKALLLMLLLGHASGGQGCEYGSQLMHNENQDFLLKLARHVAAHKYLTSPEKDRTHIDSLNPVFNKTAVLVWNQGRRPRCCLPRPFNGGAIRCGPCKEHR